MTPSQTVGPFFAIGLCRRRDNELAPDGVELAGQLLDGASDPVVDGVVEVWDAAGRRWGRSGTDRDGWFRFRIPRDCEVLEAFVFARGLLRHQRTRIYVRPAEVDETLLAHDEGGELRFDIRMQGSRATLFFQH